MCMCLCMYMHTVAESTDVFEVGINQPQGEGHIIYRYNSVHVFAFLFFLDEATSLWTILHGNFSHVTHVKNKKSFTEFQRAF